MNSNSVNSRLTPDLSSYAAACQLDPDLQSFDSTVQERTSRVISSLAADADVRSLSLDSLWQVTGCLAETNEDVVNVILQWKEDIWNNPELLDLVNSYFDTSLLTLEFCAALERSLKRARDSQLIIQIALQKFDDEHRLSADGERSYAKTLLELKKFKEVGDPFTEEFFTKFEAAAKQQKLMLEKLQSKIKKLDKKFKSLKSWRKVSNVLFVATFAAVLICSVVAAAVAAPPVVTALAAAAAVPLGSMGKWINSIWRKYEKEVKREKEIVSLMHIGTYIAIKDFDNIRLLVAKLEIEIGALLQNADFAVREENEAVILAVDEMKKKMSVFMQSIDELGEHTSKFSRDIRRARTVITQRIIKYPSSD
ncbi:hypothetical protein NMG60_11026151 [Bertholletia excelsa]